IILFFAINWGSYSELFKLKFDKLTGNFKLNPFIQQLIGSGEPVEQQLLPIVATPQQNVLQIPPLAMDVAPPDDRIIIPRINKNVPVVKVNDENLRNRDWGALEKDIQEALKEGVVHYPGTAQAGEKGNVVITGHSSYFPWDPGRFKDVFALLHEVNIGDDIIIYHDQKQVKYKVYDKKVVLPDQVDILTQEGGDRLTLITCTPVGTNLKRLVVLAKPV
ncbi:sortase, partial [Patescibacteria group bacterium]|nr:sortase [Patescibacteria group bacterium]MBU1953338.1 sortase [Patescibacteria group bacterium]